jgi:NADH-quinone oxidoreductase subunit N
MTLGAFVVLIAYERDGDAETYNDISGGAYRRPLLALTMTIFMVSLAGIPATVGFIGKLQIFKALLRADQVALVIVAVAGSLVSVAYYFRVIVYLYMRAEPDLTKVPIPHVWGALAVVLALGVLALGLFPDLLWPAIEEWVRSSPYGSLLAVP